MELPTHLDVAGKSLPIDTDFRHWIAFHRVCAADDMTDCEKVSILLLNTFGEVPADWEEALEQAILFYLCGEPPKGDPMPERVLDWDADWLTIWGDFKLWHRMDLDRARGLHWWKFMALFDALPQDSLIKYKMGLRSVDLSKIKDPEMREEYRKKKELVRLDEPSDDMDEFYVSILNH